jgi:hypothetical protein
MTRKGGMPSVAGRRPARGESNQGGAVEPVAVHRCYFCGTKHEPGIRYCATCKRYQPDTEGKTVSPCRICRELIPRGAYKCNHCSAFQRSIGRWLPTSAATISALGALAALVALLLNTYVNRPREPRSETDLEVIDYDSTHLYVRVTNDGTKPAFVGVGWFKLASVCDWRQQVPAFCTSPGTEPPPGVLKLKADPREEALVNPGPAIVPFKRTSDFDPRPLECGDTFSKEVKQFKICLAFEVIEYQKSTRRCLVREISNLSNVNYLQFVKSANCGPG